MPAITLRLPVEPETVETVLEQLGHLWSRAAHVPFPDRMAFDLAVIETVSNTIQHSVAEPGPLEVGVELDAGDSELQATIVEYGAATPAAWAEVPPGHDAQTLDATRQHLSESGRGLALIRTLVTLGFERVGTTNVWRLCRQTGV